MGVLLIGDIIFGSNINERLERFEFESDIIEYNDIFCLCLGIRPWIR